MTSLGNHSNPFLLKMTFNYNIIKYQIIFFSLDFLDLMMKRNILATMKSQKKLKKNVYSILFIVSFFKGHWRNHVVALSRSARLKGFETRV